MATQKELEAWKVFLQGRILQEQGNNDEALSCFEKALAADPQNASFLNAKAVALRAVGKDAAAAVTRIESQYRELARTLVGDKDKPEDWIKALESVAAEADRAAIAPAEAVTVVW